MPVVHFLSPEQWSHGIAKCASAPMPRLRSHAVKECLAGKANIQRNTNLLLPMTVLCSSQSACTSRDDGYGVVSFGPAQSAGRGPYFGNCKH